MSTPVLSNLRAAYPGACLGLVASVEAGALLRGHPHVDILEVRERGSIGWWRAAKALRRRRVDWAFILPNSFQSALVAYLSGARRRTGYARDGRSALLTEPIAFWPKEKLHQVEEYLALLEGAGVPVIERLPSLHLRPEGQAFAEGVWRASGIRPEEPILGLNPGARFGATKLWDPLRYAAVADRLAREEGARIVIFGDRQEVPLAARIQENLKAAAVNMAGGDDLPKLAAMLRRCSVLLTGDTGPMHIAAALGTPVVALFGPTDARHTAPYGRGHTVLRRDLFCSPCFLKRCPYGHECMEELGVEEVIEAVRSKLRLAHRVGAN
jgi:heptosyltransferase-2